MTEHVRQTMQGELGAHLEPLWFLGRSGCPVSILSVQQRRRHEGHSVLGQSAVGKTTFHQSNLQERP